MKPAITWRQGVPISLTLAAMMAGFFSILVTVEGMANLNAGQYHLWSAKLIMLAMILDGLDGIMARKLKGCSEIGAELDTYVDMTAFGIAPALLIYVVCLPSQQEWRVLMTAAVVLSGVVRLARFKATDPYRGQMGYSGLPITACAAWVSLFIYISQSEPRKAIPWLTQGPVAVIFLMGVLLFIILQVSNVRYPKPTKRPSLFILSVVLVALLITPWRHLLARDPWQRLDIYSAFVMIVLGLGYVICGPLYLKRVASRAKPGPNGDE